MPKKAKKKSNKIKIVFIVSGVITILLLTWIIVLSSNSQTLTDGMRLSPYERNNFIKALVSLFALGGLISISSLIYILKRKENIDDLYLKKDEE